MLPDAVLPVRLSLACRSVHALCFRFARSTTSLHSTPNTNTSLRSPRLLSPLNPRSCGRATFTRSTPHLSVFQSSPGAACARRCRVTLSPSAPLQPPQLRRFTHRPHHFSKDSRTARRCSARSPETPTATTKSEITPSPAARHPPTPCLPTGRGLRLAFRHPVMYVSVLLGEGVFRFPAMRKFTACRRRISA